MGKAKKKALIVVSLVPEADLTDNKKIEKQIKTESSIPFLAEIETVNIFYLSPNKERIEV